MMNKFIFGFIALLALNIASPVFAASDDNNKTVTVTTTTAVETDDAKADETVKIDDVTPTIEETTPTAMEDAVKQGVKEETKVETKAEEPAPEEEKKSIFSNIFSKSDDKAEEAPAPKEEAEREPKPTPKSKIGLYEAECMIMGGGTIYGQVKEGSDPAREDKIEIENMNTHKKTVVSPDNAVCTFKPINK